MTSRRDHSARRDGIAASQRQLRMGEELRHALAEVMTRGDIRDPVLRDASITVTEVRISPDLRNATVFVTPLGGENMAGIVEALQRARGYFRAQVARAVEARFVPDLRFEADRSFENARRVDELLRETQGAPDEGAPEGRPDDRRDDQEDGNGHGA